MKDNEVFSLLDTVKPCPFCGGKNVGLIYKEDDDVWGITHDDESCFLRTDEDCETVNDCWFLSAKDAVQAWNNRNEKNE